MAKRISKVEKVLIKELVYKGILTHRNVRIVLDDDTKLRVYDYSIQEKTNDFILALSDGTNKRFSNDKSYNFELPKRFKIIKINKEGV